jgi:peptidoglycan hydrolase-like protein with peptidoglycan-binding domain
MSTPPRDRRGRAGRVPAVATAGLVLAASAGFAARGLWAGGSRTAAAAAGVPVAVASVRRTDVTERQVVAGTLGYLGAYSVIDETGPGIVTWLPSAGSVVRRGQALFRLAGQPVTLFYGPVPAWRDFGPGMTAGPDVRELQRNLAVLGFDPGAADGQFGWSTQAAVDRWQLAHGMPVTGSIPLGEVAFLAGPLRVTGTAPLGASAAAGTAVVSGTSDTPAVSVSLTVGGPAVKPGDPVLVTLPDGTTTIRGTVASVGRVASIPGAGQDAGANGAGQGSGAAQAAAIPVTISIRRPAVDAGLDQAPVQVEITQQQDANVLAVPVTALLATPGGGYAVRASGAAGRLIPVTTGLFDDATGLVEVTGPGLSAGLAVEVAQE